MCSALSCEGDFSGCRTPGTAKARWRCDGLTFAGSLGERLDRKRSTHRAAAAAAAAMLSSSMSGVVWCQSVGSVYEYVYSLRVVQVGVEGRVPHTSSRRTVSRLSSPSTSMA